MTKRSRRDWPPPRYVEPPPVPNVYKPGDRVIPGPLYWFKRAARDDGKPYVSPEPKAEQALLALLGTNAAAVVMCCLLVGVVITAIVLLVARA